MTASLSHGSTTNTRLLSKTLTLERGFSATAHTSLYFWLYYMLTLHPFPPFPSATTKMFLSIFFIVFFYVFPHSKKKKRWLRFCLYFIANIRSWVRTVWVVDNAFSYIYFVTMSATLPQQWNWFSKILFARACSAVTLKRNVCLPRAVPKFCPQFTVLDFFYIWRCPVFLLALIPKMWQCVSFPLSTWVLRHAPACRYLY